MNAKAILGAALLLLGVFVFWNRGVAYDAGDIFALFWPSIFIIPLGLFFHWLYFGALQRRGIGLLVPGGILLTVGIVCQIGMMYDLWHVLWPGFILAPAVGLFELYWFGKRRKGLLIPIYILGGLALLFFAVFSLSSLLTYLSDKPWIGILMIVVGAYILMSRKKEA